MLAATANKMKNKLSSLTKNLAAENTSLFAAMGESYSSLIENKFIHADAYPETGFH